MTHEKRPGGEKILVRILTAVVTMVVVLLLVSTARTKMQGYTEDSCVGDSFPVYEGESLDIEVVGPHDTTTEDTISYLGGTYTRYLGADILGGVYVGRPIAVLTEAGGENGRHEAGTTVYQWQNYAPWYRIAIRGADGGNYYYERWTKEALAELTMEESLPKDHQVKSIVLRKAKGTQVGRITDPHVIEKLLSALRKGGGYTKTTRQERDGDHVTPITDSTGRYVDLVLADDSVLTIIAYNEETGYCLGQFRLPDGWLAELYEYEIYEVNEGLGSTEYGSQLVGEWARPAVREIEPWVDGKEIFSMGTLWVDDQRLCMGYSGCFGPQASRGWAVLADDVAGDLRVEDMEIWYRTTDGAVAYLYFWYPHGQGQLYDEMDAGEDLSKYVKEHTILYEGPFVKVQVRDGVVWTLDRSGVLRREDQQIASHVTCFMLDASGTIYGTNEGLYRLQETTGGVCRLADGDISAVTSAELFVYYATEQGQVRCVCVDGSEDRLVCQADVIEMQWYRMEDWRFFLVTDPQNTLWSVLADGQLVKVAEHVEAAQLVDYSLWVRHQADGEEDVESQWTDSEKTGLTNVKRIALSELLG